MSWKIRQFFRKYGLMLLIGLIAFTGYSHITGGGGSLGRTVRNSTRWVYQVPVVGSLLRQGKRTSRSSYISYSNGSRKKFHKASRGKKKFHGKRSRRGRRR